MAGEIRDRRPQLRLTKGIALDDKSKLVIKVAAAREISELPTVLSGYTYKEGPYPAMQGSVAYVAPLFTAQPVLIGLSGLWGKEEYDGTTSGWIDFPLYALSADLLLPLVDGFTVKANAWKGTNLDSYLGGILQGVNPVAMETDPMHRGLGLPVGDARSEDQRRRLDRSAASGRTADGDRAEQELANAEFLRVPQRHDQPDGRLPGGR